MATWGQQGVLWTVRDGRGWNAETQLLLPKTTGKFSVLETFVKTYRRSGTLVGIVYKMVEGLELSGSPQGTSSLLMTLGLCWPTTHPTKAVSLWLGSLCFLPQALASQAWWISVEITPVCSVCFH